MLVEGRAYDLDLGDAFRLAFIPLKIIPVQVEEEDNQRRDLLGVFYQPFVLQNANWSVVIVAETLVGREEEG